MEQKSFLTADEVIELLKEALPDDETWHEAYKELAEKTKTHFFGYNYIGFEPPSDKLIRLLQYGATILRSRGIYVYFKFNQTPPRPRLILFIAGECGRVYERLKKQAEYLADLSVFIDEHENELPKSMTAKKKKIEDYANTIASRFLWQLGELYIQGDKEALKSLCEEAWEFADEIDAYLDRIIDLRRLHAISLIL